MTFLQGSALASNFLKSHTEKVPELSTKFGKKNVLKGINCDGCSEGNGS